MPGSLGYARGVRGAPVCRQYGGTPLIYASIDDYVPVVELLLGRRASLEPKDEVSGPSTHTRPARAAPGHARVCAE